MSRPTDPFDRAVQAEERMRAKAAVLDSPTGMLGLVFRWFAMLGAAWAAIVVTHWVVFPEPRWLAVLHTVVFVVMAGYWTITAAFITQLRKRRPDFFED